MVAPRRPAQAVGNTSIAFVSKAAAAAGIKDKYGLSKAVEPVVRCRGLKKTDMVHNDAMPVIKVDPETFEVTADGVKLTCEPAKELPLAQKVTRAR
jgi:urease alpha subunit